MSCAVTSDARFGVGLAVAIENFDRVLFAGDGDAVGKRLFDLGQHPLIGFAEGGDRSGLRADHADFDGAGSGA